MCKLTTAPKPIVILPLASEFNEKVAIDLKKLNDRYIIHIIDINIVSVIIVRKTPNEVINALMKHWIGVFGVMQAVLTDNG